MNFYRSKRINCFIFTIILLFSTALCGCANSEKKILGQWEYVDGGRTFGDLEFFSDGTYTSDSVNYDGKYSIDGNRIKLTGVLVSAKVYTFEIKGDTLNLMYDDGDVYATYERAD